jgi:hypothetical protein
VWSRTREKREERGEPGEGIEEFLERAGRARLPVASSELMGCSHSKRNRCEWEILKDVRVNTAENDACGS